MPADSITPIDVHPWVAAGAERIRFGVSIYPQPPDWRDFIRVVQRMETLGYDSYWSYDHPTANADCWTALTALAGATERLRLGTMVDCVLYRSPYLLARLAADVDRFSGGRLVLGVGIGDLPEEFDQMGLPYPPVAARQAALEETIRILRGLWSGEPFQVTGEHFSVRTDGTLLPPVQQPRVPILLAGGGEKVTLRQVAQFADASNMGAHASIGRAVSTADIERKFAALRAHCEAFDRPFTSILRSQFTMPLILAETPAALKAKLASMPAETLAWCGPALFSGVPDEAVTFYRGLADAGFQYFIANVLGGDEETIELLGTAVQPAFA